MKDRQYKILQILKRYAKERDGATAMEFGILIIPFSALLFGIIELAIVFFISSSVSHAVQESARLVRTGQFQQVCQDAEAFKAEVCDNMAGLSGKCAQRLRIDVVSSPTGKFVPGLLPATPTEEDPDNAGEPQILPDSYVNTVSEAVVVVRAQYYHKLAVPGELTFLANQPGNYRVLTATTAFRNEPFPGGCGS